MQKIPHPSLFLGEKRIQERIRSSGQKHYSRTQDGSIIIINDCHNQLFVYLLKCGTKVDFIYIYIYCTNHKNWSKINIMYWYIWTHVVENTCGGKTRATNEQLESRIEALEMWIHRTICRISCQQNLEKWIHRRVSRILCKQNQVLNYKRGCERKERWWKK